MELQWPLILFTTFMAWSAGTFGALGVYAVRGEGRKAYVPALVVTLVLMAIGGISVFMHLQHWERIFNGFGHITSGITQELIAIVLMAIVMVVFFVFTRRTADDEKLPAWVGVLAIVVAAALCIVMAHSYMMPSLPAWNSVLQVCSIVGVACAFGTGTMAFLAADAPLNGLANIAGTAVNAVCSVAYIAFLATVASQFTQIGFYFDPTGPTRGITDPTVLSPFDGASMALTVVVIVAVIVAVAAAVLGKKQGNWKLWGAVIVVCAFVAALCLRVVFYQMGASVYPFTDLSALVE